MMWSVVFSNQEERKEKKRKDRKENGKMENTRALVLSFNFFIFFFLPLDSGAG